MTKKKILLVGDGNHQFITNYSKWLNKFQTPQNFEIDILSLSKISPFNSTYYSKIHEIKNIFFLKIKGLSKYYRLFKFKKILSGLPKYDYVHFHYFGKDSHYISNQISENTSSKIIISIWGSDMYRNKSDSFILACKNAYLITFANQESIEFFKSKYAWSKNNLELCRFGLAPLENLKKLHQSKDDCKIDLGLNSKKIAVTIGYNMAPEQQHLEILNQFAKKNILSLQDDIELIIPITYGGSEKYKHKLLAKLNELPFEYKIFDNYLSDNDIAKIRKASDIMLQLQTTDQFSGSMQEYLFANNIVITGSWLPYKTLKDNNCWFYEVDYFTQLESLVPYIILNYKLLQNKTKDNLKSINFLSSWDNNIEKWYNLYN